MNIVMDGKDCGHCACSHYVNKLKMELYCVKKHFHPRKHDACTGFERSQHEKLILNPEFIRVLKLLQLC